MASNSDYRPAAIVTINGDQHQHPPARINSASAWPRFQNHSKILHVVHTGLLMTVYAPLVALLQVRFQNEKQSPFETHYSFMLMSVVALIIATCTSGILLHIMDDHSQSLMRNHFSLIHYMILKAVFCVSAILAPLSLVLTLFVPHNLIWIGYLIICILFGIVVGSNICGYMKLRGNRGSMQLRN